MSVRLSVFGSLLGRPFRDNGGAIVRIINPTFGMLVIIGAHAGTKGRINMIGQRYGLLLVTKECSERTASRGRKFECLCDCGALTIISGNNLRTGHTKSYWDSMDSYFDKLEKHLREKIKGLTECIGVEISILDIKIFDLEVWNREHKKPRR